MLLQLKLCVCGSTSELGNGAVLLLLESIADWGVLAGLPSVAPIDFVQGNHERNTFLSQHCQTLNGLLFQAVHQIDHQNSDVAQRRTTRSKIGEGFVPRCINHQHTRNGQFDLFGFVRLVIRIDH